MRYLAINPDIPIDTLRYYYVSKFNINPTPRIFSFRNIKIIEIKDQKNNDKIVQNFISCSGFEIDGKRIIIMPICSDNKLFSAIHDSMYNEGGILENLFDSKFNGWLDLSEFNKKNNVNFNLNDNNILSSILFLCAFYSYTNEKNVRIINMKNNNLQTLEAFLPSKKVFPSLETIIIEGNNISESKSYHEFREIKSSGVVVQKSTGGWPIGYKFNIVKNPEPSVEYDAPEIAVSKAEEPNIVINPSEFTPNPFLISFLQQSSQDMSYISKYYGASAIMSVTAETSTDLVPYQPFARSLMHGRDNFVQGPEQIGEFNLAIFGPSVIFNIKKIQFCEVFQNGYIIVLHGWFIDRREVKIGFDRSLLIGILNENFFITNDQIHFRSVIE
ncbi:hypothetical protein M9Y10_002828 [Tritrichomonas musculus]|uniref:NTF2 domain-containing protein n=1 Tax=Tritrichomonas musculus TaxID=1915356 RepID=A0ABR2LBT6_9EUKA